ncbi:MAG: hypothetical protein R3F30_11695 [Planctomycetota bacterium]
MSSIYRNIVMSGASPVLVEPIGDIDMTGFNALSIQVTITGLVPGTGASAAPYSNLKVHMWEGVEYSNPVLSGTWTITAGLGSFIDVAYLGGPTISYSQGRHVRLSFESVGGGGATTPPSMLFDVFAVPVNV